jgi:hypothetical protein
MQDNDGKLTSKFITPSSVLYEDNVEIRFINYFYGDNITSNTLLGSASASSQIINTITGETLVSTVAASSAFASGVLPNEQIKEYRYTCPKVTKLVFDNTIPKDSTIKGYWLITNGNIKIRATYQNDYISLTSETVTIPLSRVKTSNSIGDIHSNVGYTFELNKYNTSSGASQLGAFGYLTISEYLKNPYGLNAVSIYCTHSDCIYKRCSHPDPTIRKNFVLDTGRVGCAHNKIWDADPNNFVCEAEDAHLVNPFIMHLEGI